MQPVDKKTPSDFKSFLELEKEITKQIQRQEPFFVHIFIEIFPDITCVLSWPILKETALFKKLSKNIDSVSTCIIITSIAVSSISSVCLFLSNSTPLKTVFIFIYISSHTALALLSGAYLKKYFLLKRNHQEVNAIVVVVKALFKKIHDLDHLHTKSKEESQKLLSELKKHAKEQKELRVAAEEAISALKKAPEKLENILNQIQILTPTADLLANNTAILKEKVHALQLEHRALKTSVASLVLVKDDLLKETAHLKEARRLLLETCQLLNKTVSLQKKN